MNKQIDTLRKVFKVIQSCKTYEQLTVARRYAEQYILLFSLVDEQILGLEMVIKEQFKNINYENN